MIDVPADALPLRIWVVQFVPRPEAAGEAQPTLVTCRSEDQARDEASRFSGRYEATVYEASITWRMVEP